MNELAEILHSYGPQYRQKYGERIPLSHLIAMTAIEQCRTEALGGHLYYCDQCQHSCYSYHSCKNRHCPKCQNEVAQQWLQRQQQLLLPTPYFMVTFTLPAELRSITRSNQKLLYNILFRTSAQALQELARDPRFVGGQIGLIGVLQTWTRDLRYHPHVHYLVPGGGLSPDDQQWLPSRPRFLVHVTPLAKLFRAKFQAALKKTDLYKLVPAHLWRKDWVAHSQPVGSGQSALHYLAPYIFRVAISNKRIVTVQDGQVTFSYKASVKGKMKRRTLPAEEFIQRFLQHTLPKGFVKVRYYGLFSPAQRQRLHQATQLLENLSLPQDQPKSEVGPTCESERKAEQPTIRCPHCGQPMRWQQKLRPTWQQPP